MGHVQDMALEIGTEEPRPKPAELTVHVRGLFVWLFLVSCKKLYCVCTHTPSDELLAT